MEHMSIYEFMERFPTEESAAKYFERQFWNGKPVCPH